MRREVVVHVSRCRHSVHAPASGETALVKPWRGVQFRRAMHSERQATDERAAFRLTAEEPEARTLSGVVERVVFHNAENGFCVLRVKLPDQRPGAGLPEEPAPAGKPISRISPCTRRQRPRSRPSCRSVGNTL